MNPKCEPFRNRLAVADRESLSQDHELRAHLESCDACLELTESLFRLDQAFAGLSEIDAPDAAVQSLLASEALTAPQAAQSPQRRASRLLPSPFTLAIAASILAAAGLGTALWTMREGDAPRVAIVKGEVAPTDELGAGSAVGDAVDKLAELRMAQRELEPSSQLAGQGPVDGFDDELSSLNRDLGRLQQGFSEVEGEDAPAAAAPAREPRSVATPKPAEAPGAFGIEDSRRRDRAKTKEDAGQDAQVVGGLASDLVTGEAGKAGASADASEVPEMDGLILDLEAPQSREAFETKRQDGNTFGNRTPAGRAVLTCSLSSCSCSRPRWRCWELPSSAVTCGWTRRRSTLCAPSRLPDALISRSTVAPFSPC